MHYRLVMEPIGNIETSPGLDAVFAALSDPTRRSILTHLTKGAATVGELSAPFDMSQPAISKHLKVLERAGLIERGRDKQKRPVRLRARPMANAVDWLTTFWDFWAGGLDQLDALLVELKQQDAKDGGDDR